MQLISIINYVGLLKTEGLKSDNAEKYLVETLQSVVNQTLDDYEIITINDGSKDGTLDILKEYEKEYPNFTVISKENGGVSAARNDGLNVAQGKYVYFCNENNTGRTIICNGRRKKNMESV